MQKKIFGIFVIALSLLLVPGVDAEARTIESDLTNEPELLMADEAPNDLSRNNRDGWVSVSGMWLFYIDDVRQTGWLQVGSDRFFLNPPIGAFGHLWGEIEGRMLTGLVHDGSGFYFLNTAETTANHVSGRQEGAMIMGRVNIDGSWLLFNRSGRWQGRFDSYPVYGQFSNYWWPPSITNRITTIPIRAFSFDAPWQHALHTGINNWNGQHTPINFTTNWETNNTVSVESRAENWFGLTTSWSSGGLTHRFEIVLNSRLLTAHAGNLSAYITSTFTHELGHVIGLRDNPERAPWGNGSIMNHSRNRNVLTAPTPWDVNNVNRIY